MGELASVQSPAAGGLEKRHALLMLAVLVVAVVLERLLYKSTVHASELVVYRHEGTSTFLRPRNAWFVAHASVLMHTVAVVGAALAVYLSPAFVATRAGLAARWAAATVLAGLVYLFFVSSALAGGFY